MYFVLIITELIKLTVSTCSLSKCSQGSHDLNLIKNMHMEAVGKDINTHGRRAVCCCNLVA